MKIVRAIIEAVEQVVEQFSTAKISTNKGQEFSDVKRYQGYGFASVPVNAGVEFGCEGLVYERNGDRYLLCENDPRFRPPQIKSGDTVLHTDKKNHYALLSSINSTITLQSGIQTSYQQDKTGRIRMQNQMADLELTVDHIKGTIGLTELTMTNELVTLKVGSSTVGISKDGIVIDSPFTTINSQSLTISGNLTVGGDTLLKGKLSHPDHNH